MARARPRIVRQNLISCRFARVWLSLYIYIYIHLNIEDFVGFGTRDLPKKRSVAKSHLALI